MSTMVEAYRDDLAYIHDAGFGHIARSAGPVLVEDLRRRSVERGLVIDLGCGSGLLSETVATAGFDVLGIDLSPALLAIARQRVPRGRFAVGSVLTAELPPCVAVAAVGEILNFLFDPSNTRESLARLFSRVFGALAPGGLFLFDVAEPGRVPGPGPHKGHAEGEDWAVLWTTEEDREHGLLTRNITSFRKVGELYRRDHEVHRLRLLPRSEVAALLLEVGFEVQILDAYGSLPFAPGHVGFLARNPERA
jgi:SAM-dependent methyltransferase